MATFMDVVCGRPVTDADARDKGGWPPAQAVDKGAIAATKRYHEGQWFHFCSLACRQKFIASPDTYIAQAKQARGQG